MSEKMDRGDDPLRAARNFAYWFLQQPHHRQAAFVRQWIENNPEPALVASATDEGPTLRAAVARLGEAVEGSGPERVGWDAAIAAVLDLLAARPSATDEARAAEIERDYAAVRQSIAYGRADAASATDEGHALNPDHIEAAEFARPDSSGSAIAEGPGRWDTHELAKVLHSARGHDFPVGQCGSCLDLADNTMRQDAALMGEPVREAHDGSRLAGSPARPAVPEAHEPWCFRRHSGDCVDGPGEQRCATHEQPLVRCSDNAIDCEEARPAVPEGLDVEAAKDRVIQIARGMAGYISGGVPATGNLDRALADLDTALRSKEPT